MNMLNSFRQNLQYSARMLWKSPSFSAVAILTLALGIGANATIFSFINGLLLRPIPGVERPDRLVGIYTSDYSSGPYGGSSFPDYVDLRQQATAFSDLAAYDSASLNLSGVATPERLRVGLVTSNYFQVLGIGSHLGRTLRAEDDASGAPQTVVLSHAFWQTHFGSDSSVLGRALTLGDKPYTVVGVTAESFHGLRVGSQPDVWLRMEEDRDEGSRGNRGIGITGRLRDEASLKQAQTEVNAIANRLAQSYPQTNMGTLADPKAPRPIVAVTEERITPEGRQNVRAVTVLLFVVVGLVLLIACANVANLLLARASSRRREIAIRLALGASRWRLIRQLFTREHSAGVDWWRRSLDRNVLDSWSHSKVLSSKRRKQPRLTVDWRVLTFTLAVSLLTGVLFGLAPALQASKPALISTLKDDKGSSALRLTRFGLRGLLVTAQIALSLLLLISAGLFLRSLQNAVVFDPGFDNHNLLFASLATGQKLKKSQLESFYEELSTTLKAEPGVRSVGLSAVVPLGGGGERRNLFIEGYQPRIGEDLELNTNVVGVNYFDAIGIPLVQGREFNSGDREGAPGVVMVNEEFAQRYFPGDKAVGKRVRTDSEGPWVEIIGVVRTAKYRNLREAPLPFVYLPLGQAMRGDMTLVVRTTTDPSSMRRNVRSVLQRLNRDIPIYSVKTIGEQIEAALAPDRMIAVLLAVFGGAALLLASVGIYGVVSYAVSQRTHEIGIRMALGARSTDVLRLVVRDGMRLAIVGVVVGLAGAFAITRVVDSLLFGITPTDLSTFTIVTLGLLLIALIACYVPARRATKVDPLVALRYE
jgi:predicted permease